MSIDTAMIRRRLEWGTVAPDVLGYVPVNAEALRDDVTALCDEVDRLRRALAGHLFDGESLGTREAIRSELITAGFEAMNELDRLRARAGRHARTLRSIAADLEMQLPETSAELREMADGLSDSGETAPDRGA
jgi:hypothetical protein